MGLKKIIKSYRKLGARRFFKKWGDGLTNLTPLQQTRTALWGFPAIFGGLFWGIVVTFLGKIYWLCLILLGSLPITTMQLVSQIQKYRAQKKVEDLMKQAK